MDREQLDLILRHIDQRFDSVESVIRENKQEGKERFEKMEDKVNKLDAKMVKLLFIVMLIAEGSRVSIPFLKGLMQ
jgi:SMC interacting uncharacterized protein involved in chromosome segregation